MVTDKEIHYKFTKLFVNLKKPHIISNLMTWQSGDIYMDLLFTYFYHHKHSYFIHSDQFVDVEDAQT